MELDENLPKPEDAENLILGYQLFVQELTGTDDFVADINSKTIGHFIAAAWICKRKAVPVRKFLVRLHSKHRKMEENKIVPPHQLSSDYAEKAAEEIRIEAYQNTDLGRAKAKALLNDTLPLENDHDYQHGIDMIFQGFIFEDSAYHSIYVAERQLAKYGEVHPETASYILKNGIDYEVPR